MRPLEVRLLAIDQDKRGTVVLAGLVYALWLYAQVFPPAAQELDVLFRQSCEKECRETRDEGFCARYCACMLNELEMAGDLPKLFSDEEDAELSERVSGMVAACTEASENNMTKETAP